MKRFLRKTLSLLRKTIRGIGLRNKIVFLALCLSVECRSLGWVWGKILKCFSCGGKLSVNGIHPATGKSFSMEIRTGNFADSFIFWEFISGGFYKPPAFAESIVDCGANIGFFAVHAGLLFPNAKMVCYEPDEANYQMLKRNLQMNRIQADCRMRGVWSSDFSGFFHPRESFDGFISEEPSLYPVVCELPKIPAKSWLKLDVEGAEYEVLPAVLDGDSWPSHISMEVHDFHNRGGVIRDLLVQKGYQLQIVTDGSSQPPFAEITGRTNCNRNQ
jgi:hypothetical protein